MLAGVYGEHGMNELDRERAAAQRAAGLLTLSTSPWCSSLARHVCSPITSPGAEQRRHSL